MSRSILTRSEIHGLGSLFTWEGSWPGYSAIHLLYREKPNIRTPDSIQMATAIKTGASFFLTNDVRLPSLPNLKTLVLDDLKKDT